MILCTNCGTHNPDDAHQCVNCQRKLQSRRTWSVANGQRGTANAAEPVWRTIEPLLHVMDEHSAQLVKRCAEVWTYAALLIASAMVMLWTEEWRYLAAGIVLTAVLAKLRGL